MLCPNFTQYLLTNNWYPKPQLCDIHSLSPRYKFVICKTLFLIYSISLVWECSLKCDAIALSFRMIIEIQLMQCYCKCVSLFDKVDIEVKDFTWLILKIEKYV